MKCNILLPEDIYTSYLQIVNEIKFTRREIDIIAYLLSGKSAKTIATCLSISPKTIEAHMRNIAMKVECNSRDGIIDFIEKSKKFFLIKEHYLSLLTQTSFEEQLLKIAAQLSSECPTCTIVYWRDQEYHSILIRSLERHLKLAGVKTLIETKEEQIFLKNPVENRESSKTNLVIYAVPETMDEQGEEKITSLTQKTKEEKNSIVALFPKKNLKDGILQDSGNPEHLYYLERENYYDFTFIVLKKLLQNTKLEQIILDFKNHHESICGTSEIIHERSLPEGKPLVRISLMSQLDTYIHNFFNILKAGKKYFFIGSCILSIGALCTLFLTKEGDPKLHSDMAARADLSIPTQSVFLDRPYLMEQLNQSFQGHKGIQSVALTGMGGSGKTTLARHYTRQQNANVVWEINAESKDKLINSFESLSEALSKTKEEKEKLREFRDLKDAKEREKRIILFVRDKLKHIQDWILIYDNVVKFTDTQNYFPHDPSVWGRGKVILITRDNNIKNNNNINETIQIGELSPKDKLALFVKIMTNGNSYKFTTAQNEQAKKFLNDIPPFPLDVSIAAYYLKATNVSYKTYLEKLTQYDKDFENVQQNLLEEASYYTKTRYGIITLSLQNISNSHKDFRDLLLFISLIDSQNIPRDLLDKYKTSTVVDNFIYNLKKHSFVTSEATLSSGSTPTFSIHRSTRAIALTYLTKLLDTEKNKHFIEPIGAVFKDYIAEVIDKEDFTKMNLLIRHSEMFLSHSNLLTDFVIAPIDGELGSVYRDLGKHEKAKQLFEQCIEIYRKNFYENHFWFAQALGRLGRVYSDQGNYPKAKQLLEQAITIYRNNSYENNPWFARTLGWLGNVYREQGDHKKAKQLFEESLIIYKKNSYDNHPWFAHALGRLGSIYREQCNYEKAKQLLEKSLVIYRKNSYENSPWFARTLTWLGSVYRDLGNNEKAKELLEEGLAIYRKNYYENHPWSAWTLVWLGNVHREQGNYEKAKQSLEESLVIYKKNSYENHPWFARALTGLGCICKEQGNYEKAKKFFEESLQVYKKNSYENHPWFARTLEHLGNIYKDQGNYEKARQLFEHSLGIYRRNQFEYHPWFALTLASLGSVYRDLGNYEKAKDLLERSFQAYEKTCGKHHIDVASVLMNLGQVYMLESNMEAAEILMNRALRIFQTKKYVESYVSLESLSDLYLKKATQHIKKEYIQQSTSFKKQAVNYLKQAQEVVKTHFPKDSPHILRIEEKLKKLTPY
ncbi:MAG: hypothetical protein BGO67_02160 [Alphaproteobacteria bacterium 41-28]|nr:MAG: hypothetical protein BGO67_02160 [Alphaproteobacteria bacterium 41-28]